MSDTVVIAFLRSSRKAQKIALHLNGRFVPYRKGIFEQVLASSGRIVALMATGIVVRSVAPFLKDKWTDPAIVVVSPDLRYAIPLTGGHHGANALAKELIPLGIRPVITTATEAMGKESVESVAAQGGYEILNRTSTRRVNAAILDGDVPVYAVNGPAIVLAGPSVSVLMRGGEYAVGIGCRKGVTSAEVVDAIKNALNEQSLSLDDVFAYATTDKKIHEQGLSDAVRTLSAGLIFLDDKTINGQDVHSQSKASRIGLLGVAEPCALALAKKKELLMKKTVFGRVTIAIAR